MVQGYPAEAGEGSEPDALSEKLTTTLIYSLTVLEAGSWKSRCLQGWLLLESPRAPVPACPAPVAASDLSTPWLQSQVPPIASSIVTCDILLCVIPSLFCLL